MLIICNLSNLFCRQTLSWRVSIYMEHDNVLYNYIVETIYDKID